MALVTCDQLNKGLEKKQGLLADCDGNPLADNEKVVTCADLAKKLGKIELPNKHDASVQVVSAFDDEIGFIHNRLNKGN